MNRKKLSIEALKVKSFVTQVNIRHIISGAEPDAVSDGDASRCIDAAETADNYQCEETIEKCDGRDPIFRIG